MTAFIDNSSNVVKMAGYRARRAAMANTGSPAPPYVLWYPGVGYMMRNVPEMQHGAPGKQRRDPTR
jgi:hypothetical protein